MKQLLFCITLLFISLFSFSQTKQETLVIYIPYTDTLSQEMIDSINNQTGDYILSYHPKMKHLIPDMHCYRDKTPGRRIGVFSVAKDRKVSFSQGNLIYVRKNKEWRFADNQYFVIGRGNSENARLGARIDLFGWSGRDSKVPFGIGVSTNADSYAGEFVDWGVNEIQGDAAGTWRTLSKEEWDYIISGRENATQLRTKANVSGQKGVVLLPDDWVLPEGCELELVADSVVLAAGVNELTEEQWRALEEANAVFLPAAGSRLSDKMRNFNVFGGYWTSTPRELSTSYLYDFHVAPCQYVSYSLLHFGRSVRLVHDTIVPLDKEYVDLGLSVMWATCNVGAETPEEYGDYFAWGEVEPKDEYTWATYKWGDGTESVMTKYNKTDGLTTLELEDDAAHVNWGGEWRMPTMAEAQELIDYCHWELVKINGIDGYLITSKMPGYGDRSIFLPYAGYINHDLNSIPIGVVLRCWTSTKRGNTNAYNLYNNKIYHNTRRVGMSVRPVVATDREPLPPITPAKRIGVFSVAKDKQVSFSQGNLQYIQSLNHWRFADNQYDYIGTDNVKDGALADRIDLFGWSAKDSKAPWGISTSTNNDDYVGEFLDWGTNVIQGDEANTWRTLSKDEWEYLFEKRKNAQNLYGVAQVNGSNGIIILPDDWSFDNGISFKTGLHSVETADYSIFQSFTDQEWSVLESFGAVFIHASGWREGGSIEKSQISGYYWSCTPYNNTDSYRMTFYSYYLKPCDIHYKYRGRSVRLVHDTIVPLDKEYVDLGLSVMWATCNVGAETPEEYGDYFAWGEVEPKEVYSWATYKHGTSASKLTKYTSKDGLTTLMLEDDAAHANRGGEWRMPTVDECNELIEQCTWTWTTYNNVAGYRVTAKNGRSIFFPAVGYKGAGPSYPAGQYGLYWVSDLQGDRNNYANLLMLKHDQLPTKVGRQGTRCYGFAVRPVYDDVPEPCVVVKVNDTLLINMMCVEGGTFTMGDDNSDNASPAHQVVLSDYYIGQTEVTQALWKAVMGTNPSKYNDDPYKPVECVSWEDAQMFVKKLSEKTGLKFRLPTEAEWEYAARGGKHSRGYTYIGSNNIDEVAWYNDNSGQETHVVGEKLPNELGLYDMSGNVWEWCQDWHEPYTAEAQENPQGASEGTKPVIRGGCWHYNPTQCTPTYRYSYYNRTGSGASVGFRIVMEVSRE